MKASGIRAISAAPLQFTGAPAPGAARVRAGAIVDGGVGEAGHGDMIALHGAPT